MRFKNTPLNKFSDSKLNKLATGKKMGSENAAQMTETVIL